MSAKIDAIEIKPGDCFIVKWCGSVEESIAISGWRKGHIIVLGPLNCKRKRFMFSREGVEELKEE